MKWSFTSKLEKKITQYLQDLDLINLSFFDGIRYYLDERKEEFLNRKLRMFNRGKAIWTCYAEK